MKKRALVMAGLIALTVLASTRKAQAKGMLAGTIPLEAYAANAANPTHTLLLITCIQCRSPNHSRFSNRSADGAKEYQRKQERAFNGPADNYFFSQVWMDENSRQRQLLSTARENEMT